MPKRNYWIPNVRVDVPDMQAGTDGFTSAQFQQALNRIIVGNMGRVMHGFRIQIPNQITNPGQFTVWNGISIDRSGQIITNEQDLLSQRSITLSADGTYYVEVQFITTPSDTGARGFWDETYNNGLDLSGDPLPPGHENVVNVATRLTPDWQIVTPVSTTGFEITTNANSTKVPLAVIKILGGIVSGGTTAAFASTLATAATPGDFSVKVVDSRLMPDVFTLNIGVESLSVSSNDRENGILGLSAGVVTGGAIGTRATVAGASPNLFLAENLVPGFPGSSTTTDARQRLWQGNEETGYGYGQDPAAASPARGDIQIKDMRQYIDFVAAQLRELKFGSARATDIGKLSPPITWNASPRYFEFAGGVSGARTCTVSIGDGVTSWGDFNLSKYADMQLCVAAAVSALPAAGGTIYIKGSPNPYVFSTASAVNANKSIRLVGDGPSATVLTTGGTVTGIQFTTTGYVSIENMTLNGSTAGSVAPIRFTSAPSSLYMHNVISNGYVLFDVAVDNVLFDQCSFTVVTTSTSTNAALAINSPVTNAVFRRCVFISQLASLPAVNIAGASNNILFEECTFQRTGTGATGVVALSTTCSRIKFHHCTFSGTNGDNLAVGMTIGIGASYIVAEDCKSTCPAGFVVCDGLLDSAFDRCEISNLAASATGIKFTGTTLSQRCKITRCRFVQAGTPNATPCRGVGMLYAQYCLLDGCAFTDLDTAIELGGTGITSVTVSNCFISASQTGRVRYGIYSNSSTWQTVKIINCDMALGPAISNNDSSTGDSWGIRSNSTMVSCTIANNHIVGFGVPGTTANAGGMRLIGQMFQMVIANNVITNMNGLTTQRGIELAVSGSVSTNIVISGNAIKSIGDDASARGNSRGIYCSIEPSRLVITDNVISLIGNTSIASTHAGIYMLGDGGTTHQSDVSISNNQIDTVVSNSTADSTALIYCANVRGASITNNNVSATSTNVWGIWVQDAGVGGAIMGDVIVSGNTITSTSTAGFNVGLKIGTFTNINTGGRYIVQSNIVKNWNTIGIDISMSNLTGDGMVIGQNIVETTVAPGTIIGIKCVAVFRSTIHGNMVSLLDNNATNKQGIVVNTTSDLVNVSGNTVYIQKGDTTVTTGIDTRGADTQTVVNGNVVSFAVADAYSLAIAVSGRTFVSGNMVRGVNVAAISKTVTGAGTPQSRALKDGVRNAEAAVDPGAFTEVGLNWNA